MLADLEFAVRIEPPPPWVPGLFHLCAFDRALHVYAAEGLVLIKRLAHDGVRCFEPSPWPEVTPRWC